MYNLVPDKNIYMLEKLSRSQLSDTNGGNGLKKFYSW